MKEDKLEDIKKKEKSKIAYVFGIFMIAIYCGMGSLFLFSNIFSLQFSQTIRVILGILLFGYGIFRAYRVIKRRDDDE